MVSTADGVKLIAAETARLKEYLADTGPLDWAKDSACAGWTVGDVIGHLGWAAEFYADAISQGRYGVTTPPEGLPESGSLSGEEVHEMIARRSKEYTSFSDTELVDAFASSVDRLNVLFSDMEDDDWSKECWGMRSLRTAESYINSRINELVVHSWDIRSRLTPQAVLSPEGVPVVLERLPLWLEELGLAEFRSTKLDGRIRFQTTGAAQFSRDVVFGDDGNRVEAPTGDPTGVLTCDADILALLCWGRLQAKEALADGRISSTGQVEEFTSWLSL